MACDYQCRTHTPTSNPTHLNYDRVRSAADGAGNRREVGDMDVDGKYHRLGVVSGNPPYTVRNSGVLCNQR